MPFHLHGGHLREVRAIYGLAHRNVPPTISAGHRLAELDTQTPNPAGHLTCRGGTESVFEVHRLGMPVVRR